MRHRLEKQCGTCGSYVWCGRQCRNAPPTGQIVQKPDPWDVAVEEERNPPPKVKPLVEKNAPVSAPVKAKKQKAKQKAPNSIRFPQEVLEFFKSDEPGWQRRINDALLEYVRQRDG